MQVIIFQLKGIVDLSKAQMEGRMRSNSYIIDINKDPNIK
jgi:hypothetical protein